MVKTIKIFGSPGTGKTTTLLNILEEKIAEGYRPDKIGFFSSSLIKSMIFWIGARISSVT